MAQSRRTMAGRRLPCDATATWIGAACFAVTGGILSCGSSDLAAETLSSVVTRLLAVVLAQGLTMIQPQLSGWLLDAAARCLATATAKFLLWFGLF